MNFDRKAVIAAGAVLFSQLGGVAHASEKAVRYFTIDTTTPMTLYQLANLCQQDTDTVQAKLTEVATRLAGNANALQVVGRYGQEPLNGSAPNPTHPLPLNHHSFCYLDFTTSVDDVQYNSYSAVHHTHLSNSTWDTACLPEFNQIKADPNMLILNYEKSATLFQGRICEVTTVQAVKVGASPTPASAATKRSLQ